MPSAPHSLPLKSTRDLVQTYAAELLARGEEVRQAAILERIAAEHGIKASPNLVNDEVKKFWAKTGPALSARLRRPGIPEAVCLSFDQIWDVALNAAAAGHEEERRQLQAHTEAAVADAEHARAEARTASERFKAQTREVEGLHADKTRLTEQLVLNETERQELAAELRKLSEKTAEQQAQQLLEQQRLQGQVDSLQQQLSQLRESSQRELLALGQSHQTELVKTQDFLMLETARVRDEHKAKTEKLSKELEHERSLTDQLRLLRSKTSDEAAELRGRLEAMTQSLTRLEQHNRQLSEQHQALQTVLLESVRNQIKDRDAELNLEEGKKEIP
ncbi:DNA-binding protein [Pseudomonas silesiensis]|uniref:DNA-binding protein n=1 Tax=Pseudomonas silesiensis TaxID=1853130 RepID=UPI0034D4AF18